MQVEGKNTLVAALAEEPHRTVALLLRSHSYVLSGDWLWDLHSEAVFCSDVMLTAPPDWEGARGLLHPDDVPAISTAISRAADGQPLALSFRLITTYGEVKTLRGTNLALHETEPVAITDSHILEAFVAEQERAAREEREQFGRCSSELLESLTHAGTWWYNLSTGETWYSDAVFRLHGLLPQSLNSHLHTFHSFLHPDDRTAVLDALGTALARQVPLQLDYRLVLPDNTQKRVQQNLNWTFTQKGQTLLHGFFRDTTAQRVSEEQLELAHAATEFQRQLLHFAEGATGIGFWQLNVVTRKLVYSDNYYRLFGLKPQSLPASFSSFLNYVHPDDRSAYEAVLLQVRTAQTAPAIEFRIVTPEGKVRYVRQKGRSLVSGTDVMMVGTLQDITVQKGLEKKLAELQEVVHLQNVLHQQAENLAGLASWRWNLRTGDISWSDTFYELLGQKPAAGKLTQKRLQQAVHPEDQTLFTDNLGLLLTEGKETDFAFRLVSKGAILHLQASFRLHSHNGQEYFIGLVQNRSAEEETRRNLTSRMRLVEMLSDSIPDLVLVTDIDHTVVLWNRGCEEVFGVKKERAIGQNLYDLQPQLKETPAFRLLERVLEGETQALLNVQPPSPLRGFYNISFLPMRNEAGKVIGALHLLQDVTKEHRLHLALSGRLKLIEKLVEASVDRIIALDRDMNYLYWNQKASAHYGLEKEAVIGKNILEVFPRHQQLPSYGQFREALRGNTVHLPVGSKETETYSETYLIPVLNEKGEADAVLWITHDLSNEYRLLEEQKKAEEHIREQSHYLQRITETVPDMISIMELETKQFTFLNAETFREHGFDAADMARHTKEENELIVHADDRLLLDRYFQRLALASDEDTISAEYRALTASGEWNWFLVRGKVFQRDTNGKATHVLNAIENITKQKKTEQEFLAAKETLQATLDSSLYVVQAFQAVRDESGRIVDFTWLMNNQKAIAQNGDRIGERLLQHSPGVVKSGLFDMFVQVTETGISVDHEVFYSHEQFDRRWFHQTLVKMGDGFVMNTEDITDRKKAQEEIRKSRELLKATIDSSLDMIQVFEAVRNAQGEIIDFVWTLNNEAAERMYGDVIGKSLLQNNPGVVEEGIFDAFKRVVETGVPDQHERHYVHEQFDGWYFQSTVKLNDGVTTTTKDISERKKAEMEVLRLKEEAAQQATDKYYSIFNAIDEGFCIYELVYDNNGNAVDLRWVEVNPAYKKQTGLENTVGKLASKVMPGTEKYWLEIYDKVAKTGKPVRFENWHEPTGRWYYTFSSRIGGANSKQVAVVFADITEHKQAEDALRESEERFRTYVTAAFDVVYKMSADWKTMYHLEGKDFLVSTSGNAAWVDSYIPEHERIRVQEAVDDAIRHKKIFELEHQVIDATGHLAWTYSRAVPRLNDRGEIVEWIGAATNVTNRRQTEDTLRVSEEKYRAIFNSINEGFSLLEILFDEKGEAYDVLIRDANAAQDRIDGVRAIIGKRVREFLPNIEMKWIQRYATIARSGEPEHFEDWSEANQRWYEVNASRVGGEGSHLVAIVYNDISERKQAETQLKDFAAFLEQQVTERTAALQRSTEELEKNVTVLQQAEEMAQMGSWEYNLRTGIFHWSEGMYALFGLPKGSKVSPETFVDVALEEDRTVAKRILKSLKKTHFPFEELIQIKRGTEVRLLMVKGSVVQDEQQQPQRIVGVSLDITDSRAAEEKIKETQHWLEQTAQASPDAICIYNLKKKEPVYLNNCLAKWLETTPEDLVRMGIDGRLKLIHPDDRLRVLHFNEKLRAAADYSILTVEYRLLGKNNTLLWVRNRSKVFLRNAGGEVTHTLSFLQDITEEKAAEQVLINLNASLEKKNGELESKNEEITSFAFVASHDLREPLRKIHTFSDWLLTKEPSLSENGRHHVEKMAGAVKRLELLINDVLSLTKVHVGNERVKAVDLNRLLQQLKEEMHEKLQQTGAVIEADVLPSVAGAENQLLYLFQNLVSNALKFQPKNGHPFIRINAACDGEWNKIAVTDNGLGIPEEYHKRIFEMFRRLYSREEYEGTGMGLAICKKIMEKHGGKITVESSLGKGATFTCWFRAQLFTSAGE